MSPKIDQMLITGYGSLDRLISKFDLEIAELSDKSDLVKRGARLLKEEPDR